MIDPTIITAALAFTESAVNRLLFHDPATLKRLEAVDGKILKVIVKDYEVSFWIRFSNDSFHFASAGPAEVDTQIESTSAIYLKLVQSDNPQTVLANEDVHIQGSSQILLSYAEAFSDLDIDLEGLLADYFGDMTGQFLGQGLRKTFGFAQSIQKKFHSDLSDWLHYESGLLPFEYQVDEFKQRLQSLRTRLDRLEAKARLIEIEQAKD